MRVLGDRAVPIGVLIATLGVPTLVSSFKTGARLGEYVGGVRITGECRGRPEFNKVEPRITYEVQWTMPSGATRRGLVEIDRYLRDKLQHGDELVLVSFHGAKPRCNLRESPFQPPAGADRRGDRDLAGVSKCDCDRRGIVACVPERPSG